MENMTLADKYLTFSEESKNLLKPDAVELLIDTFNKVYPGICDFFNNGELRDVVFETDPNHGSPALITVFVIATDDDTGVEIERKILENNKIKFNPNDQIFKNTPIDIDFITHELVHAAQNYGFANCPTWICEGLADYGREKFGVNNKECGWKTYRVVSNKHNYEVGYIITAGFFIWIEKNIDASFAKDLNNTVKSGKYNDNYFIEKMGKTVDELWQMYLNSNRADFIAWIEEYTGSPLPEEMRDKIKSGEFDDELDSYLINITGKSLDDLCTLWEGSFHF